MSPTVKDYTAGSNNPDRVGSTLRDVSEQAASESKTMRDNLADAASDAAAMLKEKGAEFADGAQGLASEVKDRFQGRIDEQKDAGADYVARLADAMRRAAHEFERDMPIAAKYIGVAASGVDDYAEKFREGNLTDLIEGTKAFAKRQPTAFLGLTFLAGFGLVRFLKSSSANSNEPAGARSSDDRERTPQGAPHSSRR